MLSGGDSLNLRPGWGSVENLERRNPMNGLCSGHIYDTPNEEVIRDKNKDMNWKESDAVDGQSFIAYVQVYSAKTATSLKSAVPLAY